MSQIGLFDGTDGKAANTTLIGYGIQTEDSDYRAHVAYGVQRVYVFPTKSGLAAIRTHSYTELPVKTRDIVTAKGYAVPISHIDGLSEVLIPLDLHQQVRIEKFMPTGEQGKLAAIIVAGMMKRSLIPLPVLVNFADDHALQVRGTDIIVNSHLHIQVKLDFRGGDRRYGGTGNLFIQVAECNPFRQY